MKEIIRSSFLYDFYKDLLTKKQSETFRAYYLNDYSLQEIAENAGTSRQAVSDILRRTKKILEDYENTLKYSEKYTKRIEKLKELEDNLIKQKHNLENFDEIIDMIEKLKYLD